MNEQEKEPKAKRVARKIWKDTVWSGVIVAVIVGLGGLILKASNILPEDKPPVRCTASGPNVNVRADQNLNAAMTFQVSPGEYFEILKDGKDDVVHDKSGRWKYIEYEKKKGWIFSAYMKCK